MSVAASGVNNCQMVGIPDNRIDSLSDKMKKLAIRVGLIFASISISTATGGLGLILLGACSIPALRLNLGVASAAVGTLLTTYVTFLCTAMASGSPIATTASIVFAGLIPAVPGIGLIALGILLLKNYDKYSWGFVEKMMKKNI
jgi:hypothetical protein